MINKTIDLWKDLPYESKGNDDFRPTLDTYIVKGEKIRGAVLFLLRSIFMCLIFKMKKLYFQLRMI